MFYVLISWYIDGAAVYVTGVGYVTAYKIIGLAFVIGVKIFSCSVVAVKYLVFVEDLICNFKIVHIKVFVYEL